MVLTWGGRQIVALLEGFGQFQSGVPPWVVCFNGIALIWSTVICHELFYNFSNYRSFIVDDDVFLILNVFLQCIDLQSSR